MFGFGFNGGNCSCPRQIRARKSRHILVRASNRICLKVKLAGRRERFLTTVNANKVCRPSVHASLRLSSFDTAAPLILFTFCAGRDGHIIYFGCDVLACPVCICMCVCQCVRMSCEERRRSCCPALLAVSALEISWLREICARSLTNVRIMRKWKA